MAAGQDALKAIGDIQVELLDIVRVAKGDYMALPKALVDAAPLVRDFANLQGEIKDLSALNLAEYQAVAHAALELLFEVAKAAVA
jgi:hypothetical protein